MVDDRAHAETHATPSEVMLVVRRAGAWALAPVPGGDLISVDLAAVLSRIKGEVAAPDLAAVHPLEATATLRETWMWSGRLDGATVRTESPDGRAVDLDHRDLALVDHLDAGADASAIAAATGLDRVEGLHRLARLVDAGCLEVSGHVAPTAPATPAPQARRAVRSTLVAPAAAAVGRALAGRLRTTVRRQQATGEAAAAPPPAAPVVAAAPTPPPAPVLTAAPPPHPDGRERIPVYSIWFEATAPLLSLGMLTAAARQHADGSLNDVFEIRRPETAESFLADLATRSGPAILLSSDYVWSLEHNLRAARSAKEEHPEVDLFVVHGGPSCPTFEVDAEAFLDDHGDVAHVLVRGEGEHVICRLLDELTTTLPGLDGDALAQIPGLTFRHPGTGAVVRTADAERIADLDALPSPYLSGEFDHIPAEAWQQVLAIESTRGCPYGCSFCDWGSSTLSRIRKFDLSRVRAEVEWSSRHQIATAVVIDANFGILARDVDTARHIAETFERTGHPATFAFFPAKNTTKHLTRIMDILFRSGIGVSGALSLQTTDEATLEAIHRRNVSGEQYVRLAAEFRRRGQPILGELMIGLPGQTYDSYRTDLQFFFDLEVQARTWPNRMLPNAPMNEPAYRERWQIGTGEFDLVTSTSTFTEDDLAAMLRLRKVGVIAEHMGTLRHVLRLVQWDHGIDATVVMDAISRVTAERPTDYPLLTWLVEYFDLVPGAPIGWRHVYDDVRRFLEHELGVPPSSALDAVIDLQVALMPRPGRIFPHTVELGHDYLAYYRDATRTLFTTGFPGEPTQPLAAHPPATFTVEGDPLDIGAKGMKLIGDARSAEMNGDFYVGADNAYELMSPLLRMLGHVANQGIRAQYLGPPDVEAGLERLDIAEDGDPEDGPEVVIPIRLGARR